MGVDSSFGDLTGSTGCSEVFGRDFWLSEIQRDSSFYSSGCGYAVGGLELCLASSIATTADEEGRLEILLYLEGGC